MIRKSGYWLPLSRQRRTRIAGGRTERLPHHADYYRSPRGGSDRGLIRYQRAAE
jgi:hypothetical protein